MSNLQLIIPYIQEEIWKDISGYEGCYQISSHGRVKSLERLIHNKTVGYYKIPEKILTTCDSGRAKYRKVALSVANIKKQASIHRLVLFAFIGPAPENKPACMHLDDDPSNNCLSNLQWGSYSENLQQAYDKLRHFSPKSQTGKFGKHSYCAKPVVQMDLSGNVIGFFYGAHEASRALGFTRSLISSCCQGKMPRYKGFKWSFVYLSKTIIAHVKDLANV